MPGSPDIAGAVHRKCCGIGRSHHAGVADRAAIGCHFHNALISGRGDRRGKVGDRELSRRKASGKVERAAGGVQRNGRDTAAADEGGKQETVSGRHQLGQKSGLLHWPIDGGSIDQFRHQRIECGITRGRGVARHVGIVRGVYRNGRRGRIAILTAKIGCVEQRSAIERKFFDKAILHGAGWRCLLNAIPSDRQGCGKDAAGDVNRIAGDGNGRGRHPRPTGEGDEDRCQTAGEFCNEGGNPGARVAVEVSTAGGRERARTGGAGDIDIATGIERHGQANVAAGPQNGRLRQQRGGRRVKLQHANAVALIQQQVKIAAGVALNCVELTLLRAAAKPRKDGLLRNCHGKSDQKLQKGRKIHQQKSCLHRNGKQMPGERSATITTGFCAPLYVLF